MKGLSADSVLPFLSHVSLLLGSLAGALAQEAAGDAGGGGDALRRGLTWQHNGQVFSILSRGSQYRPSGSRRAGLRGLNNPVVVLSSANDTVPAASRGSPRVPAASDDAQLRAATRQPQPEDAMVGDDPHNPYKASNYYPYYNYYHSYYRPRPRAQARRGYGTRYQQHGTTRSPEEEPKPAWFHV